MGRARYPHSTHCPADHENLEPIDTPLSGYIPLAPSASNTVYEVHLHSPLHVLLIPTNTFLPADRSHIPHSLLALSVSGRLSPHALTHPPMTLHNSYEAPPSLSITLSPSFPLILLHASAPPFTLLRTRLLCFKTRDLATSTPKLGGGGGDIYIQEERQPLFFIRFLKLFRASSSLWML